MGFNIDLLGSKRYNSTVISNLNPDQLQELRKILLKHFFCEKFHVDAKLQATIGRGDIEAMAEALKHRRLFPVFGLPSLPSARQHVT